MRIYYFDILGLTETYLLQLMFDALLHRDSNFLLQIDLYKKGLLLRSEAGI